MHPGERLDQLMRRGDTLARLAAGDGVRDHQLAQVLAHLKRHRDPTSTRKLLRELPTSPFARRSKSTRKQLTDLERHVAPALNFAADWREAAIILGWARRLVVCYRRNS